MCNLLLPTGFKGPNVIASQTCDSVLGFMMRVHRIWLWRILLLFIKPIVIIIITITIKLLLSFLSQLLLLLLVVVVVVLLLLLLLIAFSKFLNFF